jgi:DNA-binding NarL/FixJ family response regulator
MRVVIIADDARAAEGIRNVLRHAPASELLGYVDPAGRFAGPLREAAPDLILIDGHCDGTDHERVRKVRAVLPGTPLVLLTDDTAADRLGQSRSAGVDAIISKDCPAASVGLLVCEIAAGHVYLGHQPPRRRTPTVERHLTSREVELIRLVVAGESNGTIARHLWVTEATVAHEICALTAKLGVSNHTEMTQYAHAQGIVEATDAALKIAATPLVAVA